MGCCVELGHPPGNGGGLVLVALCYVLLRWLLEFVVLRVRSEAFKELEIVLLRHELAILRRKTRRSAITAIDRLLISAASRLLPRPLAIVHRHASDAAAMASALGRQAMDVRASRRSSGDAA